MEVFGFSTASGHVEDEDLFVAVFSNSPGAGKDPGAVAREIAELILGEIDVLSSQR